MRTPRELLRSFRGFLTIPAAISLSGLVAVALVFAVERHLVKWQWPIPAYLIIPGDTASNVLGAIAAASMSALVMVYSIVLLVYTLAAGSIGPRLLQRFGEDRVNQVAVGSLGATFLYSLIAMWLIRENASLNLVVGVAILYAIISVLLLLLFVHTVSTRVTIDQEAARISETLDRQIDAAIEVSSDMHSSDIASPDGAPMIVCSAGSGYVNSIEADVMAKACKEVDAVVIYAVRPGDFLAETDVVAEIYGSADHGLEKIVLAAAPLIPARDPNGDIRFSVHLLVEIALRALSPGVNDTFTAIVCIDRLSASLARAWASGLCAGVCRDEDGAVRVVYPSITARSLFLDSIPPLRRAARGNGLVTAAIIRALKRIARSVPVRDQDTVKSELEYLAQEIRMSNALEHEIEAICDEVKEAIRTIGAPGQQRAARR